MPQSDIENLEQKLKKTRKRVRKLEQELQDVRSSEVQLQENVASLEQRTAAMGVALRDVMKKVGVQKR